MLEIVEKVESSSSNPYLLFHVKINVNEKATIWFNVYKNKDGHVYARPSDVKIGDNWLSSFILTNEEGNKALARGVYDKVKEAKYI